MGWSSLKLFIVLVFVATTGFGQVNRYMVFFKDKSGTAYSTSTPLNFLSQRAIDRRIKQGISVAPEDLPVNRNYVDGVKDAGADTFFTTRWMNGLLIQCDAVLISAIEDLPYVDHVELVAPNERLLVEGRKRVELKTKELKTASSTKVQLQMIGLDEMHDAGYEGQNIVVGIFDGGFQGVNTAAPFQHIFEEDRIDLAISKDFVTNSSDVFQFDNHGTQVFSVMAAHHEGLYEGGSYEANYQLYVKDDEGSEHRI